MSLIRRCFPTWKKKQSKKNYITPKNSDNELNTPLFSDDVYKRGTRGEKQQVVSH